MLNYLIMLSGKNGSGKTTMANYLKENYNLEKISIATILKKNFCDIYDISLEDLVKYKNIFRYDWTLNDIKEQDELLYQKIISSPNNYDDKMKDDEQQIGLVEFSKQMTLLYGDYYWIGECFKANEKMFTFLYNNIIIDDWRNKFEQMYLDKYSHNRKILTVRIKGDTKRILSMGYELKKDDDLETELDNENFHYIIENKSTLEEFYNKIDQLMSLLAITRKKK